MKEIRVYTLVIQNIETGEITYEEITTSKVLNTKQAIEKISLSDDEIVIKKNFIRIKKN